jgi:hypothetical protein
VQKAGRGIGDVEFAARPKFQKMPLVYDFNTSWLSIGIGSRTITAGHQNGTQSAFSFGEACSDLGIECHSTGNRHVIAHRNPLRLG